MRISSRIVILCVCFALNFKRGREIEPAHFALEKEIGIHTYYKDEERSHENGHRNKL